MRSTFPFLVFTLWSALCFLCQSVSQSNFRVKGTNSIQRCIATTGLCTSVAIMSLFHPLESLAIDESANRAVANVLRVSYSLKQVDETIAGGSDVNQVNSIMMGVLMKKLIRLPLSNI